MSITRVENSLGSFIHVNPIQLGEVGGGASIPRPPPLPFKLFIAISQTVILTSSAPVIFPKIYLETFWRENISSWRHIGLWRHHFGNTVISQISPCHKCVVKFHWNVVLLLVLYQASRYIAIVIIFVLPLLAPNPPGCGTSEKP